jgi:hypothetical protein
MAAVAVDVTEGGDAAIMGADITQSWDSMELTHVGHLGEVLQIGGGKLSPCNGDPGEPRKPKGQEPPPSHPQSNNPSHHPEPCG